MNEELAVLGIVTQRLNEAGVSYMITGSMAANFYTVPRMTRDLDIVVELAAVDVERVVGLFRDDFYIDRDMVAEAVAARSMFNLIHSDSVIKVDMIVRKDTPYRREEFLRRRPVTVEGRKIFLASPEDLILSKLEWAKDSRSEVQLADVRNLLISVQDLDRAYLERWASQLSIAALYREVCR